MKKLVTMFKKVWSSAKAKFAIAMLVTTNVAYGATYTAATATGMKAAFASAVTTMTDILQGSGGVLITVVAVIAAVVAGATGNLKTALTALGVAIIASVGPTVATAMFSATLPF